MSAHLLGSNGGDLVQGCTWRENNLFRDCRVRRFHCCRPFSDFLLYVCRCTMYQTIVCIHSFRELLVPMLRAPCLMRRPSSHMMHSHPVYKRVSAGAGVRSP